MSRRQPSSDHIAEVMRTGEIVTRDGLSVMPDPTRENSVLCLDETALDQPSKESLERLCKAAVDEMLANAIASRKRFEERVIAEYLFGLPRSAQSIGPIC